MASMCVQCEECLEKCPKKCAIRSIILCKPFPLMHRPFAVFISKKLDFVVIYDS